MFLEGENGQISNFSFETPKGIGPYSGWNCVFLVGERKKMKLMQRPRYKRGRCKERNHAGCSDQVVRKEAYYRSGWKRRERSHDPTHVANSCVFLTKNHCDTQLSTRAAHLSFSTYAVQAAVLRGSTNYLLSAEGCGRLSEGRQGLRFDLRFLRGLCGIFAVSCGSSWL